MHRSLKRLTGSDSLSKFVARNAVASVIMALALAGCGGGGNSSSVNTVAVGVATTPTTSSGTAAALAAATALNMSISGASINSPPVVTFVVTNESGVGMAGLTATDLRFNIAKLIPGTNGGPSTWQNYINRAVSGAVQGTQERSATSYVFGTLTNYGNGTYTYKFGTDITSGNTCPAPCTDADGKPLNISYEAGALHRLGIQMSNSTYPKTSATFDFVPNGTAGTKRDIVADSTCDRCHSQLTGHGTRVEAKLCVTCHNPGSWVAGTPNTPVDFKVMVHKIHYNKAGTALPSVVAGTPYKINGTDFSKVSFPQDVRNCTLCHDGTAGAANFTAQGDNWKTQPSLEVCGACHDNVYFGTKADAAKPYQTKAHSGGVQTDSSNCALCHAAGRYTDKKDIVVAHSFATTLAAATAKFKYNILSVTSVSAGSKPVITFSVTDPTNGDKAYDIKADKAFTQTVSGDSTLNVKLGWTTAGTEIDNDGSGVSYGQPVTINALTAAVAGSTAGTYTVTSTTAIAATGTLRVMMDGHPAGNVTDPLKYTDRMAVKSVFQDTKITGTIAVRRSVVDIAKCDVCHGKLSLHGNNRVDEPGVCVICHNPNATDAARRPATLGVLTGGTDGKLEESIDFKTMIHAIHAGQSDKGGFRTKGITVYGFGGSVNDFSTVVFPGSLKDCSLCHSGTSYQLIGKWAPATTNGILGSTISTASTGSADNLRNSPMASVCSSCHDSAASKTHMQGSTAGAIYSAKTAAINAAPELCGTCHGPGGPKDVQTVHGVK